MRKETFLKLCGERDRGITAGKVGAGIDDLLRLEYLAGLLGCLEVGLSMYFTRCEKEPTMEPKNSTDTQAQWRQQFLCDAPDEETTEKIYRLLKQKDVAGFTS